MANQTDRATIDLVINGQQSQNTLRDIAAAAVNTRRALSNMAQTDPGYARQRTELEALMRAQQQRIVRINDEKTAWQKFSASASQVTAGIVGANVLTTGIQAVLGIIPAAIGRFREFQSASADMSANLGLAAKDVAYFNAQAEKMGPAMGKSAAEMLEAYKLVGSANSDLIKTPELLAEVTKQAVILSQASKMTLADATASLVGSMNQFDAGADQSQRFINVMAAGAQVGSAEIGDMAMSLKASGIVAHQTGLSFEQTNGALQSLSKESLKGEQAGTMFRNILLRLQTGADDINPKIVGLDVALDNLAKKNMGANEQLKLFGVENITAALSLIEHRDRVAEFTAELSGTSAAYDMAAKNNATLDHQMEIFWAKVNGVTLSIGTKLVPVLGDMLGQVNGLIDRLPEMGKWLAKNGEWILITAVPSLIAYNGAMIKATASAVANTVAEGYRRVAYQAGFAWLVISEAATKSYALATGVLTGQITIQTAVVTIARNVWAVFSAVLLANPIGIVVGAFAGLIAAMKYFSEHTERALDLERKKSALQRQGVKDTEASTKALQDLNKQVVGSNSLSVAEQEHLKNVIALKYKETQARLQAALARAREVAQQAAEPTFWQGVKQGAANTLTGNWGANVDQQKKETTEANKMAAYNEAKQLANVEQLQTSLKELNKLSEQVGRAPVNTGSTLSEGTGVTESKAEKKARLARERAMKAEQKHREMLDDLINQANQRTAKEEGDSYQKDLLALDQHYKKMEALAKGDAAKLKEIAELKAKELTAIEAKHQEKETKDALDAADKQAKRMNALRKEAEEQLELQREIKNSQVDTQVADGSITKEQGDQVKLTNEAVFLDAKKLLYEAHYQSLLDLYQNFEDKKSEIEQTKKTEDIAIQKEIAQNDGDQATARKATADAVVAHDKQATTAQKQQAKELYDKKKEIFNDSVTVIKSFFKENTLVYKAAMIAQQAWALGEVAVNLSRAVMAGIASSAGIPFPANLLAIAKAVAVPTLAAASAVANIRAQKFDVPAFIDGGYNRDYSNTPAGYVSTPTYYGRRNFTAAEDGKQEYIISNPMMRNPVIANLAGAMEAMRVTGAYRSAAGAMDILGMGREGQRASNGSSAASQPDPAPNMDAYMIVSAIERMHKTLEAQSGEKVVQNLFQLQKAQDYEKEIRNRTSL